MTKPTILQVVQAFDTFHKLLIAYFGTLPIDLQQTLQEIRQYIIRNKKDE